MKKALFAVSLLSTTSLDVVVSLVPGQPRMMPLTVNTPLQMYGSNAQPTVDDDDDDAEYSNPRAYIILPDGTIVQKSDPHLSLQQQQQQQQQHPFHRQYHHHHHHHRRVILPSDQCVFASQSTQTFAKTMKRRLFYNPAEQQEYVQDVALSFPGLPRLSDVVSHRDLAIRHSHEIDVNDDDDNDTTTIHDDDDEDETLTISNVLDQTGPRALAPRYLMPDNNNLPPTTSASSNEQRRRRTKPVPLSSSSSTPPPTTPFNTAKQSTTPFPTSASSSPSYSLPDTNMLTLPSRMQYSDYTRTSVVRQSTDHDNELPRRVVKPYHPPSQHQQQQQQPASFPKQQPRPQQPVFPKSVPKTPAAPSFGLPAVVATPQNPTVTVKKNHDGQAHGVVSQQQQMAGVPGAFPMKPAIAAPVFHQKQVAAVEAAPAVMGGDTKFAKQQQQPALDTPLAGFPSPTVVTDPVQEQRNGDDTDEPEVDEPAGLFEDDVVMDEDVVPHTIDPLADRIRSGSGWETPATKQHVQSAANKFAPGKQTNELTMGPVLETYWGSDARNDARAIEFPSPPPFTATDRTTANPPVTNGIPSSGGYARTTAPTIMSSPADSAEAARQKEYFAQRIAESRQLHSGKMTSSPTSTSTARAQVNERRIANGTPSSVPSSPPATDRQKERFAQRIAQSRQLHSGKLNPPPITTTPRQREYFAQRIAQSRQQAWETSCKRREQSITKPPINTGNSYFAQRIAESRQRASQLAANNKTNQ
eukprot:scaffold1923_cov160-Amphora_coffeaeformis.AAC.19